MPDYYASAFVGVRDGTVNPPNRADGRLVGAKRSTIVAAKPAGQAIAAGDRLFLGYLAPGELLREVSINTDTSLGTTTVAIGTTATPAKYRAAAVYTTPLNVPTQIGPNAAQSIAAPLTVGEEIWATFAVAGIAGSVVLCFELEFVSIK
jgi:hypothetical protein